MFWFFFDGLLSSPRNVSFLFYWLKVLFMLFFAQLGNPTLVWSKAQKVGDWVEAPDPLQFRVGTICVLCLGTPWEFFLVLVS